MVHEVVYGEWLAKIAEDYGTTVSAIWNHPENAEHRAKRGSPDVLYPGDVLVIPVTIATPPEPPASNPPVPNNFRPYIVQQGDYLQKLAFMLRFVADEVWKHPLNVHLSSRRTPNILMPGDVLWVPEDFDEFVGVVANTVNEYVAERPRSEVVVRFLDGEVPLANAPVLVHGLAGPPAPPTATDHEGTIVLHVPVTIVSLDVEVLKEDETILYTFLIGHLDPVSEPTGLLARLSSLGYLHPLGENEDLSVDLGSWLSKLAPALQAFQHAQGIDPSGIATPETIQMLTRAYGA